MSEMKALSLTQPWATLVVTGEKRIETRSWKTNYRGVIAIHAAKKFPKEAKELLNFRIFRFALSRHNYSKFEDLPLGAIIGFANLTDCQPTETLRQKISEKETLFGDYSDNRWAWTLSSFQQISPIACKGALGLWNVSNPLCEQLNTFCLLKAI